MTSQPVQAHDTRLRLHPDERALSDSQIIDVGDALRCLRDEARPAERGHRQITLFKQDPVTMVLMSFEADGALPDHAADGVVTIQVIEGALTVRVDGVDHALDRGHVLVLKPGLTHSVEAMMPSAMLLTVHMVRAQTPSPQL